MATMTKDDVETVVGLYSEETVGFFLRGHVDLKRARKLIAKQAAEQGFEEEEIAEFGVPKHDRWRRVPTSGAICDGKYIRGAKGRGAFAVTYVMVERW